MMKQPFYVPLLLGVVGLWVQLGCGGGTAGSNSTTATNGTVLLVNTTPGDGAVGVPVTTPISVTFLSAMHFASVNVGSFLVVDPDGNQVPGSFDYSVPLTATFQPTDPLQYNTVYTVTLTKDVTSVNGRHVKYGQYQFSFRTPEPPAPPAVVASSGYQITSSGAVGQSGVVPQAVFGAGTAAVPAFEYQDISATGTALGFANSDDASTPLAAPFPIYFYGSPVTTLNVCINGYVTPWVSDADFENYPFPSTKPAMIAPYFTDLVLGSFNEDVQIAGGVSPQSAVLYQVTGSAPNRELIVQWHNISHYPSDDDSSSGIGVGDFELILFEDSQSILFQYLNVSGLAGYSFGQFTTIGLNEGDGRQASEFSFNTASVSDQMAILFTPTPSVVPSPGATGVPVTTAVKATFNQPMLASSLQGAFLVSPPAPGGAAVSGQVTLDPTGTIATFTPDQNLAFDTTYTVTLTTAAESALFVDLPQPFTWSFTTSHPTSLIYQALAGLPSKTLGSYHLSGFAPDPSPSGGTTDTLATGFPGQALNFSPGLEHLVIGETWDGAWGHGYADSVYALNGETTAVIVLPAGTGAFCLFLEPGTLGEAFPCTVTATTENGYQNQQTQSIDSSSRAGGFGFAATGSPLASVSITVPSGANGFAVGEFSIAPF
jgi:hypothetical protein